jgi:hypothetical protein
MDVIAIFIVVPQMQHVIQGVWKKLHVLTIVE